MVHEAWELGVFALGHTHKESGSVHTLSAHRIALPIQTGAYGARGAGARRCFTWSRSLYERSVAHCNTLQHAATHCNTLQHAATHCNTLQHSATHCNTLQHTATHCNTLQHTATHCNTTQHTATHCNTIRCMKGMQHPTTHTATKEHTGLDHARFLQDTRCSTL